MYAIIFLTYFVLASAAPKLALHSQNNKDNSPPESQHEETLSLTRKTMPHANLYSEEEVKEFLGNSDDGMPHVPDSVLEPQESERDRDSAQKDSTGADDSFDHTDAPVDADAGLVPEGKGQGLEAPASGAKAESESEALDKGDSFLADQAHSSEDSHGEQIPRPAVSEDENKITISIDVIRMPNEDDKNRLSGHVNDHYQNAIASPRHRARPEGNSYFRGHTRSSSPSAEALAMLTQKLSKLEAEVGRLKDVVLLQGAVHIKTSERIEMMLLAQGKLAVKNDQDTRKVLKRVRRCCSCSAGGKATRALRRGRKGPTRHTASKEHQTKNPLDSNPSVNNSYPVVNENDQQNNEKSNQPHVLDRSQSDSQRQDSPNSLRLQNDNREDRPGEADKRHPLVTLQFANQTDRPGQLTTPSAVLSTTTLHKAAHKSTATAADNPQTAEAAASANVPVSTTQAPPGRQTYTSSLYDLMTGNGKTASLSTKRQTEITGNPRRDSDNVLDPVTDTTQRVWVTGKLTTVTSTIAVDGFTETRSGYRQKVNKSGANNLSPVPAPGPDTHRASSIPPHPGLKTTHAANSYSGNSTPSSKSPQESSFTHKSANNSSYYTNTLQHVANKSTDLNTGDDPHYHRDGYTTSTNEYPVNPTSPEFNANVKTEPKPEQLSSNHVTSVHVHPVTTPSTNPDQEHGDASTKPEEKTSPTLHTDDRLEQSTTAHDVTTLRTTITPSSTATPSPLPIPQPSPETPSADNIEHSSSPLTNTGQTERHPTRVAELFSSREPSTTATSSSTPPTTSSTPTATTSSTPPTTTSSTPPTTTSSTPTTTTSSTPPTTTSSTPPTTTSSTPPTTTSSTPTTTSTSTLANTTEAVSLTPTRDKLSEAVSSTTLSPTPSFIASATFQNTTLSVTHSEAAPTTEAATTTTTTTATTSSSSSAAAAAATTTAMPGTRKTSTEATAPTSSKTTPTTVTPTTTEEEDLELAVDLSTGEIRNDNLPGVVWVVHPSSSRLSADRSSARWKRSAQRAAANSERRLRLCSMQGVLKFTFTPPAKPSRHRRRDDDDGGGGGGGGGEEGGRRRLLLEMEFRNPHRWVFNVGDSRANNGFSGDGLVQENDCEAQGYGQAFAVYASDKHTDGRQKLLKLFNTFLHDKLTLVISDQSIAWDNHRGNADNLTHNSLFALSGQQDRQGPVNYDIYLGLNRVIAGRYRRGHGLCRVTARWLKG